MADGVVVQVDDNGVFRALDQISEGLDDLEPAFRATGEQMRDAAAPLVPVLSGELVDSLTITASGDSVEVGSDLVYAGVQDQGWPARNIAGSHFMDAAEETGDRVSVDELTAGIDNLVRRAGLN